jgi:hypothetical protein
VLAEEGLGGLTPEDDAEGCRRRDLCLLHLLRLHLLLPLAWLGGASGSSLLRMAAAAQRCSLGAGARGGGSRGRRYSHGPPRRRGGHGLEEKGRRCLEEKGRRRLWDKLGFGSVMRRIGCCAAAGIG